MLGWEQGGRFGEGSRVFLEEEGVEQGSGDGQGEATTGRSYMGRPGASAYPPGHQCDEGCG